ncbi:MAG TPA: 23S rRNA (pseudouridine(1915)-N(3))-methyltransferase RlmH [Terriglobales bacterium]|nr:23S rRNA (pseudouridine(1915)-N(3))-methyltransferase RlmH [Terriglobales bacterium]
MRLGIAWMGKTKYPATVAGTAEYLRRLRGFGRFASVDAVELAGKQPQRALLQRAAGTRLWLFDPAGRSFASEAFAAFLERQTATFPQEMLFAIGGADGFDPAVRAAAAGSVSLTPLTLSHELARLVALEQLYRALAILTHHPFPH